MTDYPHLSRVEDLIYDSCVIREDLQQTECMRVLDKLTKFHQQNAMECSVDDLHCVVLDVLDRLCKNIEGKDGLILLNRVTGAVSLFKDRFKTWGEAFKAADK